MLSLSAAIPCAPAAQGDALKIHLMMDASIYLVDQPILVLACVENIGSEPFHDLPSLYAGDGYMRLTLTREPTNEVIPVSGLMREVVPTVEGLTVEPGGYSVRSRESSELVWWYE